VTDHEYFDLGHDLELLEKDGDENRLSRYATTVIFAAYLLAVALLAGWFFWPKGYGTVVAAAQQEPKALLPVEAAEVLPPPVEKPPVPVPEKVIEPEPRPFTAFEITGTGSIGSTCEINVPVLLKEKFAYTADPSLRYELQDGPDWLAVSPKGRIFGDSLGLIFKKPVPDVYDLVFSVIGKDAEGNLALRASFAIRLSHGKAPPRPAALKPTKDRIVP